MRYRRIEVATWDDARVRALSSPPPNAQTLWMYLLSGPRTIAIPGVVVAREAVIADDLRWPLKGLREAFAEVIGHGLAKVDWVVGLVVLSKALLDSSGVPRESNKPQSMNVVKGWAKTFDEVPECTLKRELLHTLQIYCDALPEGFGKAFAMAFARHLVSLPLSLPDSGTGTGTGTGDPPGVPRGDLSELASSLVKSKSRSPAGPTAMEREVVARVIGKLNERSGRSYSAETASHAKLVVRLLRDGYSERDLRLVVWDRAERWAGDPKMDEFLRPDTVFGPQKFASYLAQAKQAREEHEREDERMQPTPVSALLSGLMAKETT